MLAFIARSARVAIVAPAALAATVLLAPAPAAAQGLALAEVRPASPADAPVAARTLATYRFDAGRAEGLPAEVTVADRGGELVATYRLPGERVAQPMLVIVLDTDIILQAETAKGTLTLRLHEQNGAARDGTVTGQWTLGRDSGALKGVTR